MRGRITGSRLSAAAAAAAQAAARPHPQQAPLSRIIVILRMSHMSHCHMSTPTLALALFLSIVFQNWFVSANSTDLHPIGLN